MEKETNNSINVLDITIQKTDNNISYSVYRKPTSTDTIIPSDSCHLNEHKMATIRFLVNHIVTYPMKEILINNQYDPRMLDKANDKIKTKSPKTCTEK